VGQNPLVIIPERHIQKPYSAITGQNITLRREVGEAGVVDIDGGPLRYLLG
jgi:hypothetical protein